jgi:hypothetical protein
MMTALLEKAFSEAAKLSEVEQDEFAAWMLEELASEERWEKSFAESQDILTHLAKEALVEYQTGKTEELDENNL